MQGNPLTAGLHDLWSRLTKISLSTYILLSLILGVLVGLFFGEMVRPLDFIGKAFIKLLQMAVLPYIVVSLIHGLGSLSRPTPSSSPLRASNSSCSCGLWVWSLFLSFPWPFLRWRPPPFLARLTSFPPRK